MNTHFIISVFQHEYVNHLNWLQLESQDVVHEVYMRRVPKKVVHPSISHEFREARKMWNTWNLQKRIHDERLKSRFFSLKITVVQKLLFEKNPL